MYQFLGLLILVVFLVGLATIAGVARKNIVTPVNKHKHKHVRHGWWNG